MPEDLKETQKALETCFREYRSRVDASRNMLTQAEKAYKTKIDAALSARQKAATPAKMASATGGRVMLESRMVSAR